MGVGEGPGLFLLGWGLLASGMGLVLATDFRGTAGRFLDMRERSGRRRTPSPLGPPREVRIKRMRLIGGLFCATGPAVTAFGALNLARYGIGAGATAPLHLPWPAVAVGCLVAAFVTWTLWRPSGESRRTWNAGGRLLRTVLAVHTAAVPAFVASVAFGNLVTLQGVVLIGAVAQITVLVCAPKTPEAPEAPGTAKAPAAP